LMRKSVPSSTFVDLYAAQQPAEPVSSHLRRRMAWLLCDAHGARPMAEYVVLETRVAWKQALTKAPH
jgi:hypothetical protein